MGSLATMPNQLRGMERSPLPECYRTPAGFIDQHYIYAFNTDRFADGGTYTNLSIPIIDGYDLIVRRVKGLPSVVDISQKTGKWQMKSAGSVYLSNLPMAVGFNATEVLNEWLVIPEITYPHSSQIQFDLHNTLRDTNPGGGPTIYRAQVAFCGVRRRQGIPPVAGYNYFLRPYIYNQTVTITTAQQASAGVFNPYQSVFTQIADFDFELWAIQVDQPDNTSPSCAIVLYDAAHVALSNIPIIVTYLIEPSPWGVVLADTDASIGALNPPLVYPQQSNIQLDVYSLLQAGQLPATLTFRFIGAQRKPC